tara:strand:+ start:2946 stop:5342 length:2397 start_codon:yes stop_codon:yes gene_type:complete
MNRDTVVIVESPGKCKKIEQLLNVKCMASFGHIMDIPPSIKWFDPNNIELPYEITKDKHKVVSELKKSCKRKGVKVIIASDMDREGEAIAENLMRVLSLNPSKTDRIRFNQITKKALTDAIENSGRIDMNLFHAQQARRVVDILYGFIVSPILWKNIQGRISAGRCQSPAVKICMDRQKEQQCGDKYFTAHGKLKINRSIILEITKKTRPIIRDNMSEWIENIANKKTMTLLSKKKAVRTQSAPPPHTTSTLQQESYKRHGINPKQCMAYAQKLYEGGYITYMRTDSTELSNEFKLIAKDYIINTYGDKYFGTLHKKRTSKKSVKAQEAHEAIRPIKINNIPDNSIGIGEMKIFILIWMRSVASLMSSSKYDEFVSLFEPTQDTSKSSSGNEKNTWESISKVLTFEGYQKLRYPTSNKDSDISKTMEDKSKKEAIINDNLEIGREYPINALSLKECVEKPPPPYSTADLIKTLEKTGIGRPSTFSSIVEKIQQKGYITMGKNPSLDVSMRQVSWSNNKIKASEYIQKIGGQKNVCIVTPLGQNVTEFLEMNCAPIIKLDFTSQLETSLDAIANGQIEWKSFVNDFYSKMKSCIDAIKPAPSLMNNSERTINWIKMIHKNKDTNKIIGVVHNKNGFALAEGTNNAIEKYSPMPYGSKPDDVTVEEAIEYMKLPKHIGVFNGSDVYLHLGQFGWYVKINNTNKSICKQRDMPCNDYILSRLKEVPKNEKVMSITTEWSIWKNHEKESHFIMKKNKNGKVSFYPLPNFSKTKKYTAKMCQEIADAQPKKIYKSRKKYVKKP